MKLKQQPLQQSLVKNWRSKSNPVFLEYDQKRGFDEK